ncbi:MAG: response regulator containing a CheY-like receiver domain and an DNA-binding domain [Mycobacterium sp.]|nr:response regulator containing a CheY-like receiver domain and an DNA-binding domain [Mycobacterium sp.]
MGITPCELDALTLAVFISARTAGHHLESASAKLGAANRAACASQAMSHGLLSAQILRGVSGGESVAV